MHTDKIGLFFYRHRGALLEYWLNIATDQIARAEPLDELLYFISILVKHLLQSKHAAEYQCMKCIFYLTAFAGLLRRFYVP